MKYSEIEKRQYDAQQYILLPDLSIKKNPLKYAKKIQDSDFNTIALCPFCLTSNELGKYRLEKGFHVCPKCSSRMILKTLLELNNLEKFVEFVFNYRFSGFWDKICLDIEQITKDTRFNEWNSRLYSLGLSFDFWERYKALKGDNYNE